MNRFALQLWIAIVLFFTLSMTLFFLVTARANPSYQSILHPESLRNNAAKNIAQYDWAREEKERILHRVRPYTELSYEALWKMPPPAQMPRAHVVDAQGQGRPSDGNSSTEEVPPLKNRDYGIYGDPWIFDPFLHPWKIQSPLNGERYPRNDFAAFMESALNTKGDFDLVRGNPEFLKAAQDDDPLAAFVDDSRGATVDGKQWFFAAHYCYLLWVELVQVTRDFAQLYVLTGDTEYARRAGILLHRIADLYPSMDFAISYDLGMEASSGGTGRGRIIGMIWETFLADDFITAYDAIVDALSTDKGLVKFLASRPVGAHPKTPTDVIEHIRKNLIGEAAKSVLDGRIEGNAGMHQKTLGLAALVYHQEPETSQWLKWLFTAGKGNIPKILQEDLNRDGLSPEASIGYGSIPVKAFGQLAEILLKAPSGTQFDLYKRFPKFASGFTALARTRLLEAITPVIGDDSSTMYYGTQTYPLEMLLGAYRVLGGKELAKEIWFTNGRSWEGIHGGITDEDPYAIVQALQEDWQPDKETPDFSSFLASGYGLAAIQSPFREVPRAVAMNYGRMAWGHGHADRLGLHVFAFGTSMTPDLGYPTRSMLFWPDANGFSNHVVSHNTLMIDDQNMDIACSYSGKVRLLADAGPLHAMDVDGGSEATQRGANQASIHGGHGAPPFPGVTTYRRCVVLVDVDDRNSYVVDIFWARGGSIHRLIQNGGGPEATTSGLDLTPKSGTYAGKNVGYGEFFDGPASEKYMGSGFMYLTKVKVAKPTGTFQVDWPIVPRADIPSPAAGPPVLRIHNLSPVDEVALVDGNPPKRFGNPESLRYLHRIRRGNHLHSQFISVIEPFQENPFIKQVTVLENGENDAGFFALLKVDLISGVTDWLAITENGGTVHHGDFSFSGRVGLSRTKNGTPLEQSLIEATQIRQKSQPLTLPIPAFTGYLEKTARNEAGETVLRLKVDQPLSKEAVGRYAIFDNHQRADAAFLITGVIGTDQITVGKVSLLESSKTSTGQESEVIQSGDQFSIPLTKDKKY